MDQVEEAVEVRANQVMAQSRLLFEKGEGQIKPLEETVGVMNERLERSLAGSECVEPDEERLRSSVVVLAVASHASKTRSAPELISVNDVRNT